MTSSGLVTFDSKVLWRLRWIQPRDPVTGAPMMDLTETPETSGRGKYASVAVGDILLFEFRVVCWRNTDPPIEEHHADWSFSVGYINIHQDPTAGQQQQQEYMFDIEAEIPYGSYRFEVILYGRTVQNPKRWNLGYYLSDTICLMCIPPQPLAQTDD
ncbi:MAG: hypothetical protein M1834_000567 [Cirrosporium novae-zelandiae]|nr:MAG: hypothetical protein M1834_000567 [Cirrosporium novae-zelandiae]